MDPIAVDPDLPTYLGAAYPHARNGLHYLIVNNALTQWDSERLGSADDMLSTYRAQRLESARASVLDRVRAAAKALRRDVAETDDPAQIAGWVSKAKVARRIAAGIGSELDFATIAAECAARGRGETVEQLAGRILVWVDRDTAAAALADGVQKLVEASIQNADSVEHIKALADGAIDQIEALRAMALAAPADVSAAAAIRFSIEPKMTSEIAPTSLPDVKAWSVRRVREIAENLHATFIPDGAMVHARKLREAIEAIDNPTPTAEQYPLLSGMITTVSKEAFDDAAATVINRETVWSQTAPAIERVKAEAISAINAAATVESVSAVIANIQWPQ